MSSEVVAAILSVAAIVPAVSELKVALALVRQVGRRRQQRG